MRQTVHGCALAGLTAFAVNLNGLAADKVDFVLEVKPILESACLSCHGPEKPKGKFRLDTKPAAMQGGDKGVDIVAGNPQKSPLYASTILPAGHEDIMPPKGNPLSKTQAEVVRAWI